MKRPPYYGVLLIFVLLGGCAGDELSLTRLDADAVVLAFGDSLTKGTGADAENSYPALLTGLIGREVVNAGIPGELSGDGLARLGRVLDAVQPRLVILCHGGNDMLRKKDLNAARANIEQMVLMARERGISVLLLGVPKPGLWLSPADFYVELAASMQVPIEADAIADILGDNEFKADAVHPNAAGYHQLAQRIRDKLSALGAL
jgi:acyl-CoA thioesterase I